MSKSALLTAALVVAAPAACLAANANNPYGNIDHRVDAGNNTGDAQVERLNEAQLSQNGQPQPYRPAAPPSYAAATPPRPAPAPGYAPYPYAPAYPAPVYAPPPYAYYPPAYVAYPPPFFYRPRPFFYYPY